MALQDLGMFGSMNRLIYFLEFGGWVISCSKKVVVQFVISSVTDPDCSADAFTSQQRTSSPGME